MSSCKLTHVQLKASIQSNGKTLISSDLLHWFLLASVESVYCILKIMTEAVFLQMNVLKICELYIALMGSKIVHETEGHAWLFTRIV